MRLLLIFFIILTFNQMTQASVDVDHLALKLSDVSFGAGWDAVPVIEPNIFYLKAARGAHSAKSFVSVQVHKQSERVKELRANLERKHSDRSVASKNLSVSELKKNHNCFDLKTRKKSGKIYRQFWCFGAKQAVVLTWAGLIKPSPKALKSASSIVAKSVVPE